MIDGLEHPQDARERTREYVIDMLEQLAALADQAGDPDLARAVRLVAQGTTGSRHDDRGH